MQQDSITYDSLNTRPLPKWLTDQRDGLNTYQPQKLEMKVDRSLQISLISTGVVIILAVVILSFYFLRRNRKRQ